MKNIFQKLSKKFGVEKTFPIFAPALPKMVRHIRNEKIKIFDILDKCKKEKQGK